MSCAPGGRPPAGAGHPGLPIDPDDPFDANDRVLRYLAKVTIEPAIMHGIADHVGSLASGRLADIVLWRPAYFGVKPELVLKAGYAAWGPLGEGNATRRARRADPLPTGLGRQRPRGGDALGDVRVARGGAGRRSCRARSEPTGRTVIAVGRDAWPDARSPHPQPGDGTRSRSTRRDGRVTLAGRPSRSIRSADLPLNRRYCLR